MEQKPDKISLNHAALLDLATKLRRYASETENDGYGGLFLLSASALEERAFFVAAVGAVTATQDSDWICPARALYH